MKTRNEYFRLSFARTLVILLSIASHCLFAQDDPVAAKDFSKTNSVTIWLGDAEGGRRVYGNGLEHRSLGRDGRTIAESVQGVPCRTLQLGEDGGPKGYFTFTIDPTFKARDISKVRMEVEYFDGVEPDVGVFGLQYEANGADGNPSMAYKQILPNVPLKGSGKWLKATFHLKDARFSGAQNFRTDFRLWASPPELSVSRVTITLEPSQESLPPNASLAFDAVGEAKLTDWNVQWDSGNKPAFSREVAKKNGTNSLVIRAPGEFSAGSWRTVVLLDPGLYEFVGKVRTEGMQAGIPEDRPGVCLRVSGRYSPKKVSENVDWTTLSYDLPIQARDYVELVCEFRGSEGIARFDLGSLKLKRKSNAVAPSVVPLRRNPQ